MKMSPGDIADRYSILRLKYERLPASSEIEAELSESRIAYAAERVLWSECLALYEVNGDIWNLEADIRQGKEGALEPSLDVKSMPYEKLLVLAEVGRRALQIRNLNGKRVALKNAINKRLGGHLEIKGAHASAA